MLETHTVQLQHEGLSAFQKITFFVSAALRASLATCQLRVVLPGQSPCCYSTC